METSVPGAADRSGTGPRLVLHLDINKTVIMKDPVKGIDTEAMLNSLLSETVWGTLPCPNETLPLLPSDWVLASPYPSAISPFEGAITYGEYLENVLKLPRAERNALKTSFTNAGGAGEECLPAMEALKAAMMAPKLSDTQLHSDLAELYQDGFVHILPSFFKLITTLSSRCADFRLVFRTFGVDIERVAMELNLFCEGRHPFSPVRIASLPDLQRLDGTGGGANRRLSLPYGACRLIRGPGDNDVSVEYTSPNESQPVRLAGMHALNTLLRDWFAEGRFSVAVQDDFPWWNQKCESDDSGKLMVVDSASRDFIQIFFDDNIERNRAHIVDVRRSYDLSPIPFAESNDNYIVRVEPYHAILDDNYFVGLVDAALRRTASESLATA